MALRGHECNRATRPRQAKEIPMICDVQVTLRRSARIAYWIQKMPVPQRDSRIRDAFDLPDGQSHSNLVKPPAQKYISSVFRKSCLYPTRPASMKRGERVVTIVRRDAMDARVSSDEGCGCGRRNRVVLAPLGWC